MTVIDKTTAKREAAAYNPAPAYQIVHEVIQHIKFKLESTDKLRQSKVETLNGYLGELNKLLETIYLEELSLDEVKSIIKNKTKIEYVSERMLVDSEGQSERLSEILQKIKKLDRLFTSGAGCFCGTHALGHSIYLQWDKISEKSKDMFLGLFNRFYKLDAPMQMPLFKKMLDMMSYRDIQWVLSQVLDDLIAKENGFGCKERSFYDSAQLEGVLNYLKIPYAMVDKNFKVLGSWHLMYLDEERLDTWQFNQDPIVYIYNNGSTGQDGVFRQGTHFESLVNSSRKDIITLNQNNLLEERSFEAAKKLILNITCPKTLIKDLDKIIHENEKRLKVNQKMSKDKKTFLENCLKDFKRMKATIQSTDSNMGDWIGFRDEITKKLSSQYFKHDKGFKSLLEKFLKLIETVITWFKKNVRSITQYISSSLSPA